MASTTTFIDLYKASNNTVTIMTNTTTTIINSALLVDKRCNYPSKVCHSPRAVKLCGSLHKLCKFHRKKANLNQKRLQQRRRVIRAQMAARTPFGTAYDAPAMKVDRIQMLKSDSQQQQATTTATSSASDDFSVFESSFLDNFLFVGGNSGPHNNSQGMQPTALTGFYDSYSTTNDHADAKYEAFNFELRP